MTNGEQVSSEQSGSPATKDEILTALHEADGLLSLVGYRKRNVVGIDLAGELIAASGTCRALAERIERDGIKHGRTLTAEDYSS